MGNSTQNGQRVDQPRLVRRYRILNGLGHEVGTVATYHEPIPAYAAKTDTSSSKLIAAGYTAVEISPNEPAQATPHTAPQDHEQP